MLASKITANFEALTANPFRSSTKSTLPQWLLAKTSTFARTFACVGSGIDKAALVSTFAVFFVVCRIRPASLHYAAARGQWDRWRLLWEFWEGLGSIGKYWEVLGVFGCIAANWYDIVRGQCAKWLFTPIHSHTFSYIPIFSHFYRPTHKKSTPVKGVLFSLCLTIQFCGKMLLPLIILIFDKSKF